MSSTSTWEILMPTPIQSEDAALGSCYQAEVLLHCRDMDGTEHTLRVHKDTLITQRAAELRQHRIKLMLLRFAMEYGNGRK